MATRKIVRDGPGEFRVVEKVKSGWFSSRWETIAYATSLEEAQYLRAAAMGGFENISFDEWNEIDTSEYDDE